MNDTIRQQVEMVFLDIPVLFPQVQVDKVKPIAIGSRERHQPHHEPTMPKRAVWQS